MTTHNKPRVKAGQKSGTASQGRPGSLTGEQWWRLAKGLLALSNPVTAVVTSILVPIIVRGRRVRPLWLVLGSAALFAGVILLGGGPAYLFMYRELGPAVDEGLKASDGLLGAGIGPQSPLWATLGALIARQWPTWVLDQLPVAVSVGLLWASATAAYRARFEAHWRKEEKTASAAKVDKALAKLPRWHQRANEVFALAQLEVLLGVDRLTAELFALPAFAFGKHCYIDGPSGFGKTTDLITIMRGLVEAPAAQRFRIGMVYVNMKPDPDITDAIRDIAHKAGRRLWVITEDGVGATSTYNPLRHGTAAHARNILIEAEALAQDGGFSEAHYRRSGERFTLLCLEVLDELVEQGTRYKDWTGTMRTWKRDIHHLTRLMDIETLMQQDSIVSARLGEKLRLYNEELKRDKDLAKGGSGLRQRFASAVEGAAGNVLHERPDGLDIRAALLAGDIVLFNLDAARDAQAARQIGNLVLQDLTAAFGDLGARRWHKFRGRTRAVHFWAARAWLPLRRKLGPTPEGAGRARKALHQRLIKWSQGRMEQNRMAYVVVDEFSALGGSLLQSLFERARSNGGAVTLATQVSTALEEAGPSFKDSVIKNSNVKLLHQQDTSAEEYAGLIGTKKDWAETTQIYDDVDGLGLTTRASGQGSLREVEKFRIHPNDLRDLPPGEAYVVIKAPAQQRKVKIRRMTAPAGGQLPELPTMAAVGPSVDELPGPLTTATEPAPAPVMPRPAEPGAARPVFDEHSNDHLHDDDWLSLDPAAVAPPDED